MSEFNLEAAKRGEKVQCPNKNTHGWVNCFFVGVSEHGHFVVEVSGEIRMVNKYNIRMAPKLPKKMWVQVYIGGDGLSCSPPKYSSDLAKLWAEAIPMQGRLIGEPQPIEVPDE